MLLADAVRPSIVAFVVIYGLDWVATVPPTVALCRQAFGRSGTVVFGWVFASHQIGAAIASVAAGCRPGPDRHLHGRVVQRRAAVRGRGGDLAAGAPVPGHRRVTGSVSRPVAGRSAAARPDGVQHTTSTPVTR